MSKSPREIQAPAPTPEQQAQLAADLAIAGRTMTEANEALAAASAKLDEVIVRGYRAGAPVKWMAQAAGVNRKTVYTALERNGLFTKGQTQAWDFDIVRGE